MRNHIQPNVYDAASVAVKQQAQRILARSNNLTLPAVTKGDIVAVAVSAFDRNKGDPPNIIGVVLAVGKSGHTIGTRYNNKR